jgi:hypothetical protein
LINLFSFLYKSRGINNNGNKKWGTNNNNTPRNNHSPTSNNVAFTQDPATAKQMHDRMLYLLGNLTVNINRIREKD